MGEMCGIWSVTGQRVDFSALRALGEAVSRTGERGCEAYIRASGGLWHRGASLCSQACDGGNVTVLLLTPDDGLVPRETDVLRAYLAHGLGFFGHLFGPFALCILDEREDGRVLLARDPAGRVPLYFHFAKGRLCFLSHPHKLLAVGLSPLPTDTCHVFSPSGYDRLRRL